MLGSLGMIPGLSSDTRVLILAILAIESEIAKICAR